MGPNAAFQLGDFLRQILVRQGPLSQADEGLDDLDVDLDGAFAPQDASVVSRK